MSKNATTYQIIHGDCLEVMRGMEAESVDAIVTDPPYELGFMGKAWDQTGIAYNKEMWAECLRVLKPGGYLLAFSGTRTYHRMASAIEDAGFEVRDMIEWVYGSGFPKSLNIGKAIDKLQGNERKTVREYETHDIRNAGLMDKKGAMTVSETKGTSEWEGWGTALKPAHEPICMARKPLSEKTVAENCLKWGTGGINIDESRVGENPGYKYRADANGTTFHGQQGERIKQTAEKKGSEYIESNLGRFPANLIHDNSEEVRECFPENKSSSAIRKNNQSNTSGAENGAICYGKYNDCDTFGYADSGNASRFFKAIICTAKASKSDRGEGNYHPTVKPVKVMEYLINMVTRQGCVVLDPFCGSGSTGVAALQMGRNFIGIELNPDYVELARRRVGQSMPLFAEVK
jgi:site-specific DNA-methyltransferase (adenine-specific)